MKEELEFIHRGIFGKVPKEGLCNGDTVKCKGNGNLHSIFKIISGNNTVQNLKLGLKQNREKSPKDRRKNSGSYG
jgi:hypothetical protein